MSPSPIRASMHSRNEAARRPPPRQCDHGAVPLRLCLADLHRVAADDRRHPARRHHWHLVGAHRLPARGHQPVGRVRAAWRRPRTIRDLRRRICRHGGELPALRPRAERACPHPVPSGAGHRRGHDCLGRARAGNRGHARGLRGADERIHDDGLSLWPPARAVCWRSPHRSRGLAVGLLPVDSHRIGRDRADHPGSSGAPRGAAARADLHRLPRRGAPDCAHHHADRAARRARRPAGRRRAYRP